MVLLCWYFSSEMPVLRCIYILHFLYSVMFFQAYGHSLQGPHDAVRHMIGKHAGMDDDLGVILLIRPRDVIVRCFDSVERKQQIREVVFTASML